MAAAGLADGERITTDRDGHVLLIGVNRPDKRNAFDLAALRQLAAAYERLADDEELRVGVLYAHGEHFSAGLDLAEVGPAVAEHGPAALTGNGRFDPFAVWGKPVPKPIIMAVHGIAFTLSIELALAADIVVAAADVRFRQLEIARGILPFGGATFRAPARLGWGNAMRWLLTADELGAQEAWRVGLVQEVVPAGRQVDRALELARAAAERAAVEHLGELLPAILGSQDAAEGVRSFVERRSGRFTGR